MSSLEICASISLQQIYVVEGEAEEEHHHHHFFYKKNEECLNWNLQQWVMWRFGFQISHVVDILSIVTCIDGLSGIGRAWQWNWRVEQQLLVASTGTQLLYLWAILPTCFVFSEKAKSEYHSKSFLLLHCTGYNISSFQSCSWNLLHCKASMSCVIHTGGSSTLIRHVSNMNIFLKPNGWIFFLAIAYPEMSVINGSVLWCIAHAETHQAFKAACEISGIALQCIWRLSSIGFAAIVDQC